MNNHSSAEKFLTKAVLKNRIVKFVRKNLREIYIYRYAMYNFVNSSLKSRYRRSTIGFLWSMLNPLFTMLVMALVFSSIFNHPFADFSLYIFSGLLPWNLMLHSVLNGTSSLITAERYLKKIYVPKILFPLVTIGIEIVNFLLSLLSLSLLAIFMGAKIGWALLILPIALFLTTFFLLGIVLIVSVGAVYFRDLPHILQIGMLGLFYLTPIFYQPSMASERLLNFILLNPFYYFISMFHSIIYDAVIPSTPTLMVCGILSLLSMIIGVSVFYSKERDVIYRL